MGEYDFMNLMKYGRWIWRWFKCLWDMEDVWKWFECLGDMENVWFRKFYKEDEL